VHALPPRATLVPNAIAFRDPSHGLLGTGTTTQGTISLTSDGGRTWKVALRTPRPVVWVSWFEGTLAARFDDGENVHSTNGGRTWTPFAVGYGQFNVGCPLGTQQMQNNSLTGNWSLCTNQPGAGNQGKAVYEFKTHGWTRLAYTSFPSGGGSHGGLSSYGYPQGIAMANDGFGIIWESRGTLYVTRNGGSNWVGLPKVAQPEVDFGVSAFALPKGGGFALLAKGGSNKRRLLETTDAGRHWHVVHSWS
jgi:hypothetical protein